jgi:hypothetical protein
MPAQGENAASDDMSVSLQLKQLPVFGVLDPIEFRCPLGVVTPFDCRDVSDAPSKSIEESARWRTCTPTPRTLAALLPVSLTALRIATRHT